MKIINGAILIAAGLAASTAFPQIDDEHTYEQPRLLVVEARKGQSNDIRDEMAVLAGRLRGKPDDPAARTAAVSLLLQPSPGPLPEMELPGDATASYNKDGTRILTGTGSAYRLWNASTGHLLRSMTGTAVEFTPDGKWVQTVSGDRVRFVEAASGMDGPEADHGGEIHQIHCSRDGKWLITCGSTNVKKWRFKAGKLSPVGKAIPVSGGRNGMAFTADSGLLFTWDGKRGHLLDAVPGEKRRKPLEVPAGLRFARLSPDGKLVFLSTGNTFLLLSTETGQEFAPAPENTEYITSATFSPDSQWLLLTSQTRSWAWHVSGKRPHSLRSALLDLGKVANPHFTQDAGFLVSATDDRRLKTHRLSLGILSDQQMAPDLNLTLTSGINHLVCSPDGQRVAVVRTDGWLEIRMLHQPFLPVVAFHAGSGISSIVFSPDGSRLLIAGAGGTEVYQIPAGAVHGQNLRHGMENRHALISSNNSKILTGSDQSVQLWEGDGAVRIGEPVPPGQMEFEPVFSHDSSKVLMAGSATSLLVLDTSTGRVAAHMTSGEEILGASFSPDSSRILAWSRDDRIRIWDAATGNAAFPVMEPGTRVAGALYSPDGQRVLIFHQDGHGRLWRPGEPPEPGPLIRLSSGAIAVGPYRPYPWPACFSPDSRWIATRQDAGVVQLYRTTDSTPVRQIRMSDEVRFLLFSPDSHLLAAVCSNSVSLWNPHTGQEAGSPILFSERCTGLSFDAQSRRIAVNSGKSGSSIHKSVWDLDTRRLISVSPAPIGIEDAGNPPSETLLSFHHNNARLWMGIPSTKIIDLAGMLEFHAGRLIGNDGKPADWPREHRRKWLEAFLASSDAAEPLARWLFAPHSTRTLSPNTRTKISDYIDREIDWALMPVNRSPYYYWVPQALREAYAAAPGNRLIQLTLSMTADSPFRKAFFMDHAINNLPSDIPVLSRAAEILTRIGEPARARLVSRKIKSLKSASGKNN